MAASEELIPLNERSDIEGLAEARAPLAPAEDSCLTPPVQQEGTPGFNPFSTNGRSSANNQEHQSQASILPRTEGEKVEECLKKLEERGMKWKTFVIAIICIVMKLPDVWYSEAMKYQGYSMNESIPWDEAHKSYSRCTVYTEPYANAGMVNKSLDDLTQNLTMQCKDAPNEWSYSGEGSKSSIVMELICDNVTRYQSLHIYADAGVIVGSLFWTIVIDQFGRKIPFLICSVTMAVLGIVNSVVHNYIMYRRIRGFIGFLRPGFELAGFLLAVELFSARKRTMAATLIEQFWGIGMMMLGKLMMMVQNWRHLQMITAVAGLLTIPLIGYVNESIPWLFSRGRDKDVDKIMKRVTKGNKNNNSNNDDDDDDNNRSHRNNNNSSSNNNNNSCSSCKCMSSSCLYCHCQHFCRRKIGLCQILIICSMTLLWFVTSWMYYGTSQKMTDMVDTGPMNLMLGGTMELTACSLCFFIIKKWGRRFPLAGFHFLAGVLLLLSLTEFCSELSMCFVALAKILITASFGIVHLYAVEIFPTNIRAQCMSFTIVGSALGHIAATYAQMQDTLSIGSWSLLVSGIVFGLFVQLPETNKKPLPQNLQEMQKLERFVLCRKLKTNVQKWKNCCSSKNRETGGEETAVNNQDRNSRPTTKDSNA